MAKAAARKGVVDTGLEAMFTAIFFTFLGGAGLFLFNLLLRGVAVASTKSFARQGSWQATVSQAATMVKPGFDAMFGPHSTVPDMRNILIFAVIIALAAVWVNQGAEAQSAPATAAKAGAPAKKEQ